MATRLDPVAQVVPLDHEARTQVAQRFAEAAERRRLLTRALHAPECTDHELVSDHATTDRFVRLSVSDLDDAPADAAPVHAEPAERPQLGALADQLRAHAAAYRAKAIALNARLVLLGAERARLVGGAADVDAVRQQLVRTSATLDHAVEEIGAVTSVEHQLAALTGDRRLR